MGRRPLAHLADIGRPALFLDFDGTLVDLAATPDAIVVPRGLPDLLVRLESALGGALAIVTGRRIVDIDRFLAPAVFVVAGVHGGEYRTGRGDIVRPTTEPIEADLVEAIRILERLVPGVLVEPKGATLTVHWRAVPQAADRVEAELARILEGGPDHLEISHGRKVFEVCPRDISKGAALGHLAALPAYRGRIPIMIGDDVSDESAFAAAERLGGVGYRVRGETFAAAVADFDSPRRVREWLSVLLSRISR
ncbi:trehalose-phosphatase [Pinisolibacter sp.]|uniref:trehalose-phosphatase n=1 Tax=Pinisolibacter sp. TaxID=2172024 RepID=UPI002FDE6FEE